MSGTGIKQSEKRGTPLVEAGPTAQHVLPRSLAETTAPKFSRPLTESPLHLTGAHSTTQHTQRPLSAEMVQDLLALSRSTNPTRSMGGMHLVVTPMLSFGVKAAAHFLMVMISGKDNKHASYRVDPNDGSVVPDQTLSRLESAPPPLYNFMSAGHTPRGMYEELSMPQVVTRKKE